MGDAAVAAELGQPVVVGWLNEEKKHSHIALVVPAAGGQVYIAQAGARNFLSEPVSHGFGTRPVKFWKHV